MSEAPLYANNLCRACELVSVLPAVLHIHAILLSHSHTIISIVVSCLLYNLGYPWLELLRAEPFDTHSGLQAGLLSWCVCDQKSMWIRCHMPD